MLTTLRCHTLYWRRTTGLSDRYAIGLVLASPEVDRPELFTSAPCIARLSEVERGFEPLARLDHLLNVLRWELAELPCTDPLTHVADVAGKLAQELQLDGGYLVRSLEPLTFAEHASAIMTRSFPHHVPPSPGKQNRRTTPNTRLNDWLRDGRFDDLVHKQRVEVQIRNVPVHRDFQSFQNGVMHHLSAPASFKWEGLLGELFLLNEFGAALGQTGSDAQLHLVTAASGSHIKGQTVDELRSLAGPGVGVIDLDNEANARLLTDWLHQARQHR
jgi:hypothetical protein